MDDKPVKQLAKSDFNSRISSLRDVMSTISPVVCPSPPVIPAFASKGEGVKSSLDEEHEMTEFPSGFTARTFVDHIFEKYDGKYDEQLSTIRRKVYLKVQEGNGEATVILPPGVAKSIATTISTELRSKGFVCKYRKYRNRDHQPLRQLKIRLPKGL
jgi:hypothetical protein